ncbi:MAG TPA: DUF1295 domain-containing protein [bacterium (Candidatus Stahlbacteria)]|nr:DUF1295 domain-containing protein [Candidatus Stahlbacteria bacterium]
MKFRIIWLFIIVPYFTIFFFNRFYHIPQNGYPLIYSYVLVGWLAFEFYLKNSFFQSGIVDLDKFPYWLRIAAAVYFYGSFVFANFEIENSGGNPMLGLPGLIILIIGVAVRMKADLDLINFKKQFIDNGIYQVIRQPTYLGLILISLAMGLCFNSAVVLLTGIFIGVPLFYWESRLEDGVLAKKDPKYKEYQRRVKYFGLI